MALYLVNDKNGSVWNFCPLGGGAWQFARLAECQRAKHSYVLRYKDQDPARGWVVLDESPESAEAGEIVGTPVRALVPPDDRPQDENSPTLGTWQLWGVPHTLHLEPPEGPAPLSLLRLEVPFGVLEFREEHTIGRLDMVMTGTAMADEALEEVLRKLREVLQNLAARHEMVLLVCVDAREGYMPSLKQLRRFRAFMREMSTEFLLVGRGSAVVVHTSGYKFSMTRTAVTVVQSMLPTPWQRSTVTSMEEAEEFLTQLAAETCTPKMWQLPETDDQEADPSVPKAAAAPLPGRGKETAWREEMEPVPPGFWQVAALSGRRGCDIPQLRAAIARPVNIMQLETLGGHDALVHVRSSLPPAPHGGRGSEKRDALLLDAWRRKLDARVRPPQDPLSPGSNFSGYGNDPADVEFVHMAPSSLLFCGCQCVKVDGSQPIEY